MLWYGERVRSWIPTTGWFDVRPIPELKSSIIPRPKKSWARRSNSSRKLSIGKPEVEPDIEPEVDVCPSGASLAPNKTILFPLSFDFSELTCKFFGYDITLLKFVIRLSKLGFKVSYLFSVFSLEKSRKKSNFPLVVDSSLNCNRQSGFAHFLLALTHSEGWTKLNDSQI